MARGESSGSEVRVIELPVRTALEEIGGELYVASRQPDDLLTSGDYLNCQDFAAADQDLRIPRGNGIRTFNLLALGLARDQDLRVEPLERRDDGSLALPTYWRIFYMLHNREQVKTGSRDRVLLGTQAAHLILEKSREGQTSRALSRRSKQVLEYVLNDMELTEA